MPSENILFETRPSLRKEQTAAAVFAVAILFVRYFFVTNEIVGIVLFPLLVLDFVYLVYSFIRAYFMKYRITDQYVELFEGIISRRQKRAPWLKITNFTVEQNVVERILGVTNINIDTPGHDQWEIELTNVTKEDGEQIVALLQDYIPDAKGAAASTTEHPPASAA